MKTEERFSVGMIQMSCSSDRQQNLDRAVWGIEEAARQGARLICLPELFLSPYFCQREDTALFDLAETIPGPTTETLGAVAKRLGILLVASLFERRGPGIYHNSAVLIDTDGRLAGMYRKMHIPEDPCYYEKFYFSPGDLDFPAFSTGCGKIGVLICWDQWFPEAARLAALQGAQIVCYPTAIGWHPFEKEIQGEKQRQAWQTVQRGHAVANGLYVMAVNRIGFEANEDTGSGIEFFGSSFLAGPQGEILAEAPGDQECVLIGEVDLAWAEEIRRQWPFFRDRRPESYQGLMARYLER